VLTNSRLYPSEAYKKPEKDAHNINDVILVRWKGGGQIPPPERRTKDNCEVYDYSWRPSDGDAKGNKAIYPWKV
jgi:hypothetical protein